MSTDVDAPVETGRAGPPSGRTPRFVVAALVAARNAWRQLTSMRTALVLLFLLAVAAIPGSILPQYSVNREAVDRYRAAHPDLAPVLAKLWGFEVYSSPWFAAIYLLLFTSLIGCITPRLAEHARALRTPPPDAPRRLERLPHSAELAVADESAARAALKGWRTVRREQPDGTVTLAAEKGYLKEAGNLLFHSSLLVILVGVGIGAQWGWHANRLVVTGPDQAFCNTLQQYDDYGLGPQVGPGDLADFCLELTGFKADFRENGSPISFEATTQVTDAHGRDLGSRTFAVNHPLRLDGANVYLLGHGYAPVLRYTDAKGVTQQTVVPFPFTDATLTSQGVAMFPDANGGAKDAQLGFDGLYLPTRDKAPYAVSDFPLERSPVLVLTAYRGDLGLDAGITGSVYELDQRQIETGRLKRFGDAKLLRKGETWTLPDGSRLEFVGTRQWITVSIRHDPGEQIVLVGVILLLVGLPLSLYGRRRRVWLKLRPDGTAQAGGLPRTEYPGFEDEFASLVERWRR
ncbi:cytochrome c biogenesis protein ResB [Catellatospora sp. KI3]|uniref:cytochrome c biogenesis protein ResB n=1 Tax=Catellatospora sp. KI3 TaxID=3041620 RepID=UPI002482D391|nr:cytochrome c biogenesis protein ResB [Catellatospora sp. KI3]MDI1461854.1 cytochrome c biogenesis protein ResB [Catellatospora sp. KI3]